MFEDIFTGFKRYVYNWAKPSTSENSCNVNSEREKGCGPEDTRSDIEKHFVKMTETSWKGEKQSLECLEKIMKKVERYPYLVVKGNIQSGKSALMIYYSAWMAKEHNMNVVIMLRNQTADIESLVTKFREFKKEKGIKGELEVFSFATYFKSKHIDDIIEKFQEQGKVFIMLGNNEQLIKLNKVIKDNEINPFVMCIDEADLNEKDPDTEFQKEFEKLKLTGCISHILGVTGTALSLMIKRVAELTNEQVISLEPPLNYKGIQNISMTNINVDDKKIVKKTMLTMLETKYAFYDKDSKKHPVILLVKDERVKNNQKELMNKLYQNEKIKNNWVVIVYNGDGINVKLPGNKKIKKTIGINDTLQEIKKTFGTEIKYICIISGDLANRGLSFVSSDYSWHLTHMIMCAKGSATGTNLMQYTRLCGCYNDDIPLEIFTSDEIQKELFAFDNLQERCVEKCEDPLLDVEQMKSRLEKMKMDETCVVRRNIDGKLKIKYKNLNDFDNNMYGKKIEVNTLKEAQKLVKKEFGVKPRQYVKKYVQDIIYNKENVECLKKLLKKQGYKNIYSHESESISKNPEFVTASYKKWRTLLIKEKSTNKILIFVRENEELSYNDLFVFESATGIFMAKSTGSNEDDLRKMFKNVYQLEL